MEQLFLHPAANAERQPKTDRLVLGRLLKQKAEDKRLDEAKILDAQKILVKWADLEKKGKLEKQNETKLQGAFLHEVFGDALGYVPLTDDTLQWHLEQHRSCGDQIPDAVLGHFTQGSTTPPLVVIELKGPLGHLDRDRSNGRTAVDQCWDYLINQPPTCRWGIVSNIVSFRLYERDSTKRKYEHFTLQSLRDLETFRQFYYLFQRQGLIEGYAGGVARALSLLQETNNRQRTVGEELYEGYSAQRTNLIVYLKTLGHQVDLSIEMAQRLLDRIIFIAFCEDRQLLPERTINRALQSTGFSAATNPLWQNFKNLFRFIDIGNDTHKIPRYNGGLFAEHPVDKLELPDQPWTTFFNTLATYDFRDEVNLDVLGHLFERSISELEKLKEVGLYSSESNRLKEYAEMPQSVKRKQLGIYYTPAELTLRIVQYTVDELIAERFAELAIAAGIDADQAREGMTPENEQYWRDCLTILRELKIVDPACGSGAFLFQAYNALEQRYHEVLMHLGQFDKDVANEFAREVPQWILNNNLYGVDLSPEAVEITQLALWIRSATPGQTLATLAHNIVHGNSLVHDPAIHSAGFDWRVKFPEVFQREQAGFDCVIGNPPWERIKLQEREFFSLPAPEIATATNAAKRRTLVAKLESDDPELYQRYEEALKNADALLTYCRKSNEYPLTGRGDINLYAVFCELGLRLVAPRGRVGLLCPSGIASDMTTKDFFAEVAENNRLIRLYDFENKRNFFPEVHASFRFCILNFSGKNIINKSADFVFFIHSVEELENRKRHIKLSAADIQLFNPNTKTCPIFTSKNDYKVAKSIYQNVPVLIDHNRKGKTGNAWGIKFMRMFDQTNDAELFDDGDALKRANYKLQGNVWIKAREKYLPIYEAKMMRSFDHRYGSVFEEVKNWINQGQTNETSVVQHQNPEYSVLPRWWTKTENVSSRLDARSSLLCFRDVTRATDTRTMIATMLPYTAATNKIPLVLTDTRPREELCLLGNFNSIAFDFCVKQKFGGISLNYFILEQIPTLTPDTYAKPQPWTKKKKLETWISERVLKLTCTAEDMLPLADACEFTGGSFKKEYGGRLHKWDDADRAELMAELDAAYFHLYGIDRDDAEYILSTFKGIHEADSLFADSKSTAERILELYDSYAKV